MHPITFATWIALAAATAIARAQPDDAAALQLADQAPTATQEAPQKHRLYVEGAALRGWFLAGAPENNAVRGSVDLRIDATLAPGWRGVLSDRLDLVRNDTEPKQRNVNALREAYVSWEARPDLVLDMGRVNLRQGAAWGYNPTDFFRGGSLRSIVSPDPARLRENRLGTVVVQAQSLWSGGSFAAALSPRLESEPSDSTWSLDLGSTNARNRWLLVGSHRLGALQPQLLLHGGADTPEQLGFNLSGLLNDATVAYVELATGKDRSSIARALDRAEDTQWQQRAALGFTYTTAFNLSLTAEADYNSAAPDRAQWEALHAGSPADALRLLQWSQDEQELPVRRGAFFYATWRDALVRRLDLSGFVRYDAETHSRVQWLETRYHWDRADLALQWQLYSGDPGSVFGTVPQKRTVEVSVRVYF